MPWSTYSLHSSWCIHAVPYCNIPPLVHAILHGYVGDVLSTVVCFCLMAYHMAKRADRCTFSSHLSENPVTLN
eukprot:jgi/Chrzof1/8933/Cz03g29190.t1